MIRGNIRGHEKFVHYAKTQDSRRFPADTWQFVWEMMKKSWIWNKFKKKYVHQRHDIGFRMCLVIRSKCAKLYTKARFIW